jgi:hypothetical protein
LRCDTDDFISKLSWTTYLGGCFLAKSDAKEFYMSGEHTAIVAGVLPHIEAEHMPCAEHMLWLLLFHQFVTWCGGAYRVLTGSGMGLIHSGALTDLAFWSLVESKFNLSELGVLN